MLVAAMVVGLLITAMAFVAVPIYERLAGPADNTPKIVAELTGVHEAAWEEGQIGTMIGRICRLATAWRCERGWSK